MHASFLAVYTHAHKPRASVCGSHSKTAAHRSWRVLVTVGVLNTAMIYVYASICARFAEQQTDWDTETELCSESPAPTPRKWDWSVSVRSFSDFGINGAPAKQMRHLPSAQEDWGEGGLGGWRHPANRCSSILPSVLLITTLCPWN